MEQNQPESTPSNKDDHEITDTEAKNVQDLEFEDAINYDINQEEGKAEKQIEQVIEKYTVEDYQIQEASTANLEIQEAMGDQKNPLGQQNIFFVIAKYFQLEDIMKLSQVSKQQKHLLQNSPISDKIWEQIFLHEFMFQRNRFPDLSQDADTKMFELFKTCFAQYKQMRKTMKELFEETQRNLGIVDYGFQIYLLEFDKRNQPNQFLAGIEKVTFEFVCFHKNLKDVSGIGVDALKHLRPKPQATDIQEYISQHVGPNLFSGTSQNAYFKNFQMLSLQYYGNEFNQQFVSAPSIIFQQEINRLLYGQYVLPLIQVQSSQFIWAQDPENRAGFGPCAIYHMGQSRAKIYKIANSLQELLETHTEKLRRNWFQNVKGFLEPFSRCPTDAGAYGSVTVTKGVRITAHAIFNMSISHFCAHQNKLIFPYQITITVVDGSDQEEDIQNRFEPCILTTRSWTIQDGDQTQSMSNQPGVIGQYPELSMGMTPFHYESQTFSSALPEKDGKMSGHFTFKILSGDRKGETFDAKIGEFQIRMPDGIQIIDNPFN